MAVTHHQGRRFDVRLEWDERSNGYLLERDVHPESELLGKAERTKHWTVVKGLDQGADGACVGFGTGGFCGATPLKQPGVNNQFCLDLYHLDQTLDEWPGTDYDGTSLTAGMKGLQKQKRVSTYLWLKGASQLALAIGYLSPVPIAINWRADMMDVDAVGFIHATGDNVGGHCILVSGYDAKTRVFELSQSWGESWGRDGKCFLSFDDMETLLADDGQAALPRKLRVRSH